MHSKHRPVQGLWQRRETPLEEIRERVLSESAQHSAGLKSVRASCPAKLLYCAIIRVSTEHYLISEK